MKHKRWIATATYRSANGPVDVDWHMEELDEVADFVERGPDWNALEKVVIVLNPMRAADYSTLEQAEQQ